MDEKKTLAIVGVVGAGALLLFLLTRSHAVAAGPQSVTTDGTDPGLAPAVGTDAPLYTVGGLNIPAVGYPAFNLGGPGSGSLFTFNDVHNDNAPSPGPSGGSSDGGVSGGCGCGGPSPCDNSGAGVDAYGTQADIAAAFGPLMSYLTDQLPTGIVAPGAFDPGATPVQAQVSAWKAAKSRITDSFNVLKSSTNNVMLANI